MEQALEVVVTQLCAVHAPRNTAAHDTQRNNDACGEDEATPPSRLFATAHALVSSLSTDECLRHTQAALQRLEEAVVTMTTASSSSPARLPVAALLCTLTALLLQCQQQQQRSPVMVATASEAVVAACVVWRRRFDACVLRLLCAHPPCAPDVEAAACYCVAQLACTHTSRHGAEDDAERHDENDGSGSTCADVQLCGVLRVACATLVHGELAAATVTHATAAAAAVLPLRVAVELLAQCALLLTARRPPMLVDASVVVRSGGGGSSNGDDDAATAAAARARRNVAAHCNSSGDSHNSDDAAALSHECALADRLVACCVDALLAPTSSSAQSLTVLQRDSDTVATVCRRVLLPLLLLLREQTRHTRHDAVHRNDSGSSSGGSGGAHASRRRGYRAKVTRLLHSLARDSARHDEFVTLVAALFDFLFDTTVSRRDSGSSSSSRHRPPSHGRDASVECGLRGDDDDVDLRCEPLLWRVLRRSLMYALVGDADAGRRANVELRAVYLLQRLVHLTQSSLDADTSSTAAQQPPQPQRPPRHTSRGSAATEQTTDTSSSSSLCVTFADTFAWQCGAEGSARAWDSFFVVLERLREFGWHAVRSALPRLDALVAQYTQHVEQTTITSTTRSDASTVAAATSHPSPPPPLHAVWLELLFTKLVLHPNLSVRRVGLRRVWALPPSMLRGVTLSFVCVHVFCSAADARLCGELDRTPVNESFVRLAEVCDDHNNNNSNNNNNNNNKDGDNQHQLADCGGGGSDEAFEGDEVLAVPRLQPLARALDAFYSCLFGIVVESDTSSRQRRDGSEDNDDGCDNKDEKDATAAIHAAGDEEDDDIDACVVVSRATRATAMRVLLRAALRGQPSRYMVSCLVRVLHGIAQTLLQQQQQQEQEQDVHEVTTTTTRTSVVAMLRDAGVRDALTLLVREVVHDNVPYWLDVRLTAIAFSTLLLFAVVDADTLLVPPSDEAATVDDDEDDGNDDDAAAAVTSPARQRRYRRRDATASLWPLLCLCGPLGSSGGVSVVSGEVCGVYGDVGGTALPALLCNARLVAVARDCLSMAATAAVSCTSESAATTTTAAAVAARVATWLHVDTLLARTRALLQHTHRRHSRPCCATAAPPPPSSSSPVLLRSFATHDEVAVKRHFFLLGALLLCDTAADSDTAHARLLAAVVDEVARAVCSFRVRAYGSATGLLRGLASLVELHRAVGGAAALSSLISLDVLHEMAMTTLHTHALAALATGEEAAATLLTHSHRRRDGVNNNNNNYSDDDDDDVAVAALSTETWQQLLHTRAWDVVCAAAHTMTCVTVHACYARTRVVDDDNNEDDDSAGIAAAVQCACEVLCVRELVCALRDILVRCSSDTTTKTTTAVRQCATLLLARNASRLLYSVLCGLLLIDTTTTTAAAATSTHTHVSSDDKTSDEAMTCAAVTLSCAEDVRVTSCVSVDALPSSMCAELATLLLMALQSTHTQPSHTPPAATASWSASCSRLVGVVSRYTWPTFMAQYTGTLVSAVHVLCQRVDVVARSPRTRLLRRRVCAAALHELECCTANGLPGVYDLIAWVVATLSRRHAVHDSETIASGGCSGADDGEHHASCDGGGGVPCGDDVSDDVVRLVQTMFAHASDVGATQRVRVLALAYATLHHLVDTHPCLVRDVLERTCGADDNSDHHSTGAKAATRTTTTAVRVQQTRCAEAEVCVVRGLMPESDRAVFFAAMVAALEVLREELQLQQDGGKECAHAVDNNNTDDNDDEDDGSRWSLLLPTLLRVAVLHSSGRDEDESATTMAVTEPLLGLWPDALRTTCPPAVRLAAVGRALAIATLLRCCCCDDDDEEERHDDDEDTTTRPRLPPRRTARALALTRRLLRMNCTHPVLVRTPCMPNNHTHRARMRLWQLLCALLPTVTTPHMPLSALRDVFARVVRDCVPVNNPGSVRRLIELYAMTLLKLRPALYDVLDAAFASDALRPQVSGTYVLVACHAMLHVAPRLRRRDARLAAAAATRPTTPPPPDDDDKDDEAVCAAMYDALLPRVLQYCLSSQHLLRILSHIGLYKVCMARLTGTDESNDAHAALTALTSSSAAWLPDAVRVLLPHLARGEEHVRQRQRHEAVLYYDSDSAATPRRLLCAQRREANSVLCDSLPAALFARIRFVECEMASLLAVLYPAERLRLRRWARAVQLRRAAASLAALPLLPHTATRAECYVDYTLEGVDALTIDTLDGSDNNGSGGGSAAAATGADVVNDEVQRKATPWWTSELYTELSPRALQQGNGSGSGSRRRQSLVLVTSLLQHPVNIAGLCRCGEVFAVEQVVLPDLRVLTHPHFVAAARSAERWLPLCAVAAAQLHRYLAERRLAGYTIVAIEQTSRSVSMATYAFPPRCVLVLGAEGHGIPAPLLALVDVCVEVPQYGLVRSLNVHVTGAMERVAAALSSGEWVAKVDVQHGRTYYVQPSTGRSVWDLTAVLARHSDGAATTRAVDEAAAAEHRVSARHGRRAGQRSSTAAAAAAAVPDNNVDRQQRDGDDDGAALQDMHDALRATYDALLRERARWLRDVRHCLDDAVARTRTPPQHQQPPSPALRDVQPDDAAAAVTSSSLLLSRLRARTAALCDEEVRLREALQCTASLTRRPPLQPLCDKEAADDAAALSALRARVEAHVARRALTALRTAEQHTRARLSACEAATRDALVVARDTPSHNTAAEGGDTHDGGEAAKSAAAPVTMSAAAAAALCGEVAVLRALARAACAL